MGDYSNEYYERHFVKYRSWEVEIGKYIYSILNPSSVLDLGCGVGSYLEGFYFAGCRDLMGIELNYELAKQYFVEEIKPDIRCGDVTKDLSINRMFDCVISFEVGEHISPEGTIFFVDNLTCYCKKYIIFTAAPPGQRGTNHINLMHRSVWIDMIKNRGFLYMGKMVEQYKKEWKRFGTEKYILNNLMVFKKDSVF